MTKWGFEESTTREGMGQRDRDLPAYVLDPNSPEQRSATKIMKELQDKARGAVAVDAAGVAEPVTTAWANPIESIDLSRLAAPVEAEPKQTMVDPNDPAYWLKHQTLTQGAERVNREQAGIPPRPLELD